VALLEEDKISEKPEILIHHIAIQKYLVRKTIVKCSCHAVTHGHMGKKGMQ
jgi:hypothetical protein